LPTAQLTSRTSTHTNDVHQLNELLLATVWQVPAHVGSYTGGFFFSVRSATNTMNNSLNTPCVSIQKQGELMAASLTI
jgi:hypothetical protein